MFVSGVLTHVYPLVPKLSALIVNTVDTVRQRFFLSRFLSLDKAVLFVGPTGTGKSAITNNHLLELPRDQYVTCNINFSAQTSANQTQDIIFSKLDRCAVVNFIVYKWPNYQNKLFLLLYE